VVVSGGRAWWFYFGGQREGNINWAVLPAGNDPLAYDDAPAFLPASADAASSTNQPGIAPTNRPASDRRRNRRGISINVVELKVVDGKLKFTNPNQPTYIDLKSMREEEK
jgi:hypothetical protein